MSKKKINISQEIEPSNVQIVVHKYPSFIEWIGNLFLSISNSKITFWVSLFLMIISVMIYYLTLGEDYDIWFHLKYGEYYVKNFTWKIDHSQFSWTPSLPDWIYVTWIGSSILYIAYKIALGPGLYIIQWLILLSIGGLYFYHIKSTSGVFNINHILGLFFVEITLNLTANYIKPELFSTLFFSIALFIYFQAKSSSKNLFPLYPILFLIWVNTHGGYLIGLFFISLALCGEAANFFFLKKASMTKKLLKHFAIAVALSYLSILINPYGIYYHINLFKNLFSKEYMGEATQLFAYISLWDNLFPKTYMFRFTNAAWSFILMGILFLAVCFFVYLKNKHFDITILTINIAFFYIGMNTARACIFFPLIWLFSILYTFKRGSYTSVKRNFSPFILLFILILTFNIFYHALVYYEDSSWFGSNLSESIPIKEAEFIKKHNIQGPIFNDYLIGGYMIWKMYPDYKVFIDPRYGPYIKQVWPDWINMKNILNPEGLKKFTSKYQFKTALIHMREPLIIFWLLSSPEWKLIYFDKNAVVIIHKSIIPTISPEALATDVSTNRFKDLKNPVKLSRLFNFYLAIGPSYAREILNLYTKNVRSFYKYRPKEIQTMEALINQKESELRQKQIQQQQQQQNQKTGK